MCKGYTRDGPVEHYDVEGGIYEVPGAVEEPSRDILRKFPHDTRNCCSLSEGVMQIVLQGSARSSVPKDAFSRVRRRARLTFI